MTLTYKELLNKCKKIKINKDHIKYCRNNLGDYLEPDNNTDDNLLAIMALFELKYDQAIKLINFIQKLKSYKDLDNKEVIFSKEKSSCTTIWEDCYIETNYLLQISNLKYYLKL